MRREGIKKEKKKKQTNKSRYDIQDYKKKKKVLYPTNASLPTCRKKKKKGSCNSVGFYVFLHLQNLDVRNYNFYTVAYNMVRLYFSHLYSKKYQLLLGLCFVHICSFHRTLCSALSKKDQLNHFLRTKRHVCFQFARLGFLTMASLYVYH